MDNPDGANWGDANVDQTDAQWGVQKTDNKMAQKPENLDKPIVPMDQSDAQWTDKPVSDDAQWNVAASDQSNDWGADAPQNDNQW